MKKLYTLKSLMFALPCICSIGLTAQQSLKSWGGNSKGQIGNGTSTTQNTPVMIGSANWTTVQAGSLYSMGLLSDSTLWAWGYNASGQLGDGTLADKNAPVQIGSSHWKMISANAMAATSAGIKGNGSLWAWGTGFSNAPSQVGTETSWKQIAVGSLDALALKNDGTMWYWTNFQSGSSTAVQVGTATWQLISGSSTNRFAIKADGSLWSWGTNSFGELGLGAGAPSNVTTPTQVGTDLNWQFIESGENHAVALKTDGSLWAWGYDGAAGGVLGLGVNGDKNVPTQIGTATNWKSINSGYSTSYAIKTDNTLWAWGVGCFGHGPAFVKFASPTQIGTANNWQTVSAGSDHALALGGAAISVGLNGLSKNNRISVFPNPATSAVTITVADMQSTVNVSVTDIAGRIIYSKPMLNNSETLQVEGFNKGIYFIELKGDALHVIKKIIVE